MIRGNSPKKVHYSKPPALTSYMVITALYSYVV